DTHRHGDIMSRMTNDVDNIANAVSQSITSLISGILTLIGCLAIMIYYSPLLTLVSMVVLVLTLIVTGFMSKHMGPLFAKQQGILGNLNSQTEEMVSSYKTVIAYNYQEKANEKFRQASKEYTKVGMRAQFIGGSMGPVMNFIGNVGYFLVCLMGAIFIYYGMGKTLLGAALDASIVIMFLSTTKQFTRPITEIAQLYSSLLTALAGAERVFAILDEEEEDFSKKEDFNLDTIKGDIDFRHIAFGYTKDKQVLKDFNVDVYSGHKIALVGATGSGKTTIVNLLLRFYDIDSGEIYIDDHNIFNISKKDLRSAISIVLQDPVLFSDTIENNVRYGRSDATDEEVDQALEFANCTSFVSKLENGKKTMLTEGATNISQGQRQLLTIARAILANPKILILDEATSSVDTRTEKHIQDAMVNLMKNRTSLIIAHRLSTIQDADLIVVIDGGVVIEMGNHQELIDHKGKYYSLYMTQFAGKEI
ncbi:MAG: ABC transporter ATP-binding protein, partial [Bacilli bacterium]|nr:ABC transporter ATP-binding protein [Bacilli bacterium]